MTPSLIPSIQASQFLARWYNTHQTTSLILFDIDTLSQSSIDFLLLLQKEINGKITLTHALRRLRNTILASIIEQDLSGKIGLAEVISIISQFADFSIQTALNQITLEMTELYGTPIGEESKREQQLIVLGMGKLGGNELNVSSDIDLIFIYPEKGETVPFKENQTSLSNHEFFIRVGKKLIHALAEIEEGGFVFRVDMALRPNGNSGPLSISLAMLEEYFIVQGREWERYAWIKARPITGHPEDIQALQYIVMPFVYRRYLDFNAIDAMRSMHAQIRAEVKRQEIKRPEQKNNIKLGRGGIREIEFIAQVFQLIRGGREPLLRNLSTRTTLAICAEKGLLSQEIYHQLLTAYTFLRNLEHRIQYIEDAQTHTISANPDTQLIIANMMGYSDTLSFFNELNIIRENVAQQFDAIFKDKEASDADQNKESIDLQIFARLPEAEKSEAIEHYLEMLGFKDSRRMTERLLATGRSTRLQSLPLDSKKKFLSLINSALPLILILPDQQEQTLSRLLDLFEAIARRCAYLSLLIEYPSALKRVIKMMHRSEWAAKFLTKHPILLDELLDEQLILSQPNWDEFKATLKEELDQANYDGKSDTELQMNILRDRHHAKLFKLLIQDLENKLSIEKLADQLSLLADIIVDVTLEAIWKNLSHTHQTIPYFAVIAYGKLGGKELGYASDLDVIFIYDDPNPEAPALYAKLAQRFISWMTTHTSSGILFDIDIALRPDGASGLLVSSLSAFERYQTQSAWVWEHQALSRARFCAGYLPIAPKFETIRQKTLTIIRDEQNLKTEILKMREKMYAAHLNRSNLFDIKNDRGGMIDIEFIVQYLILKHANTYPKLTSNIGNIAILKLCAELGLLPKATTEEIIAIYRNFRVMQHQARLAGVNQTRLSLDASKDAINKVSSLWDNVFK
jgi:glutamate-ammonia-ligase adenylyltransferase